jgi:SAM-dependent methyltransferase
VLDSLPRRPRGRRLARWLGKLPPPPVAEPEAPEWFLLDRELIVRAPAAAGPVTARLHGRLDATELEAMRSRVTAEERAQLAQVPDERRGKALELSLTLATVPSAEQSTGLRALEPPPDVHALLRGRSVLGGAYTYADAMVEAIEATGVRLEDAARALDFGCSSGRLVRALSAAYPEVEWHACDPQARPIAWASEHFPAVHWAHTEREPPLPYPDGHFDHVFALGIWTNFGERAALDWFDEVYRILAPGGRLGVTIQAATTLHHLAQTGLWDRAGLDAATQAMYRSGFSFHDVFGAQGDWGISNDQWGWAYITPEWVLTHLCPRWAVLGYQPGYIDDFMEMLVLERR